MHSWQELTFKTGVTLTHQTSNLCVLDLANLLEPGLSHKTCKPGLDLLACCSYLQRPLLWAAMLHQVPLCVLCCAVLCCAVLFRPHVLRHSQQGAGLCAVRERCRAALPSPGYLPGL
jgi:hypothetical protein